MRLQPSESDDLWPRLRRHLERAEDFSISFIFSPSRRRSAELQAQLEGALRWRTSLVDVFDPFEHPRWREAFLDAATGSQAERIRMRAPLWVALDRHAGRPEADAVRREALAALNERRGALERRFARPLILVLPQGFNAAVWAYAPDLWTIKGFAGELPADPGEAQRAARTSAVEAAASAPLQDAETASLPAIREWRRLAKIAATEPERVVPASGWMATAAALDAGALAMAAALAQEVSALARARAEQWPAEADAQRDLSVSLDNVGRVAEAQGEWAEAEAVYREGLSITRRVADAVGQTPQSLQDVGRALVNCAGIVTGPEKISLLREAETTYRRLATRQPDNTELKDKLARVGRMLKEAGEDRPLQGS